MQLLFFYKIRFGCELSDYQFQYQIIFQFFIFMYCFNPTRWFYEKQLPLFKSIAPDQLKRCSAIHKHWITYSGTEKIHHAVQELLLPKLRLIHEQHLNQLPPPEMTRFGSLKANGNAPHSLLLPGTNDIAIATLHLLFLVLYLFLELTHNTAPKCWWQRPDGSAIAAMIFRLQVPRFQRAANALTNRETILFTGPPQQIRSYIRQDEILSCKNFDPCSYS